MSIASGAPGSAPALSVEGLVKVYHGSGTGVRGLSMQVPFGTVHGFLGRNGAGKTTTMKCIVGLLRTRGGEMRLFGEPFRPREDLALRLRIGYSPELPSFPAHLDCRETLELYGRMRGLDLREIADETRYLSAALGLEGVLGQRVKTLSKGTQARLGVAVAMLGDPDLLILDEPTSGLDPVAISDLRGVLVGLARGSVGERRTILLSSHQLGEAQRLCSGVTIIDSGVTVAEGPIDSLIEQISGGAIYRVEFKGGSDRLVAAVMEVPGVRSVVSVPGPNPTIQIRVAGNVDPREDLARLALQHEALLLSCERQTVSLEDLFLSFVGRRSPVPGLLPTPTATSPTGAGTVTAPGGSSRPSATTGCANCGGVSPPGSRFCRHCGRPLPEPIPGAPSSAPARSAASLSCPACGHENLATYRFCQGCGRALESAAVPTGSS